MDPKKTCAIPQRNTDLAATRDIARRVIFLFVVVGIPVGLLSLAYGASQKSIVPSIMGGVMLIDSAVLWLLRKRWDSKSTVEELRSNPFKASCRTKE